MGNKVAGRKRGWDGYEPSPSPSPPPKREPHVAELTVANVPPHVQAASVAALAADTVAALGLRCTVRGGGGRLLCEGEDWRQLCDPALRLEAGGAVLALRGGGGGGGRLAEGRPRALVERLVVHHATDCSEEEARALAAGAGPLKSFVWGETTVVGAAPWHCLFWFLLTCLPVPEYQEEGVAAATAQMLHNVQMRTLRLVAYACLSRVI